MPRTTTLTAAFAYFGCVPRNVCWAWSAVSPDGKTVALTVWDDEVLPDGSVDYFGSTNLEQWTHRLGNKDRIRNLQHALEHCDGLVRVVRVTAADTQAGTRRIKQRSADPDTILKVMKLCNITGEFRAKPVKP